MHHWKGTAFPKIGKHSAILLLLTLSIARVAVADAENDSPVPPGASERTQALELRLQVEIDTILNGEVTQPSDLVLARVFGSMVLLIGRMHSYQLMTKIQNAVTPVVSGDPSVKYLRNRIRIESVKRSNRMGEFVFRSQNRASNASLKTRAQRALSRVEGLDLSQIKIITEPSSRGTLYVVGAATHHDADRAVEAIVSAGGVKKVVMAFDYLP